MKFTKMHGLGNDYIYVNMFAETLDNPAEASRKLSDRHYGIGSDGLVLIMPSNKADFRMRMFNPDGSEAEMCGNAIRCVGKYVYDNRMTKMDIIDIETMSGIKRLFLNVVSGRVETVEVNMGKPILDPLLIPAICRSDRCVNEEISVLGREYRFTAVSMGNPHCIIYLDDMEDLDIGRIGPMFEKHPIFPQRTNTEFVKVISRTCLRMRVWERGTGETLACGTGACAVLVASVLNGLSERNAVVRLLGGDLRIRWSDSDENVYMEGPAVKVFDGDVDI